MEQATAASLLDGIRQAWSRDAVLRPCDGLLDLTFENGIVTVRGEVPHIAVKKRALAGARALCAGVADRIRVAPRQPMADNEIHDLLWDVYAHEPVFHEIDVRPGEPGLRSAPVGSAAITFAVCDGVVSLAGCVPGLDCKRLAGAMAWWVPGSRDVMNGLSVAASDTFDSIAEAVRLVLEKDPCVEAGPVRVGAHGSEVTLAGAVHSEDQRHLAELDAWYVFGVDKVTNGILVRR